METNHDETAASELKTMARVYHLMGRQGEAKQLMKLVVQIESRLSADFNKSLSYHRSDGNTSLEGQNGS